ncbi:MAG: hypothetical protein QM723_23545 [Myxococcaceae bacterium]
MLVLLLLAAAPDHVARANAWLDHEADPWAYEQARAELAAALAEAPDDDAVQVANARWLRRTGQLDAANEALKVVRERSPRFEPALVEAGELALERECYYGGAIAAQLGTEALSLAADDARAWLLVARSDLSLGGTGFQRVAHADELRHSPDPWVAKQAQWLLADAYEHGTQPLPLSERCYLQALKFDRGRAGTNTLYARWLLHRGRYEEAANQASKALAFGLFVPAQQVLALALLKEAEALEATDPEAAKATRERANQACVLLAHIGGHAAACER